MIISTEIAGSMIAKSMIAESKIVLRMVTTWKGSAR